MDQEYCRSLLKKGKMKIPSRRIDRLSAGYKKRFQAVISARGGVTKYWRCRMPKLLHKPQWYLYFCSVGDTKSACALTFAENVFYVPCPRKDVCIFLIKIKTTAICYLSKPLHTTVMFHHCTNLWKASQSTENFKKNEDVMRKHLES